MELANFPVEVLSFLFFAALAAAFLDTLAGGGGLITLPALIMGGLPPLFALGTNKLQGSMGTATATFIMFRTKRVGWEDVKLLMLSAFIGSLAGTVAVQFIDTEILRFVIPATLLFIAIYFLAAPQPHEAGGVPRMPNRWYQRAVVPVIGWYDGMFGPGTGSFYVFAGVSLRGHGLIDSTAIAKTLNFATNVASLIIFLFTGKIVWCVGIVMILGQLIGALIGSQCLFKINPKYLRLLIVVMCLGMLAKYMVS
jgi:uncharacterized membrane protein YfcA